MFIEKKKEKKHQQRRRSPQSEQTRISITTPPTGAPVFEMLGFSLVSNFASFAQLILFALALGVALLCFILLKTDNQLSSIPAVGNARSKAARRREFLSGKARDLYVEGYKNVRNQPEDIIWVELNVSLVQ
jgi:hypothetical protein